MIPDYSQYRTSTVINICKNIRDSQDYSPLPILADALQDADFPDDRVLSLLRTNDLPLTQKQRLVAFIYSYESAKAVRWMEQWVRDINYSEYKTDADGNEIEDENGEPIKVGASDTDPHTFDYVGEMAQGALKGNSTGWYRGYFMCFGSDDGADYFRAGEDNVREFFRNWSLVTGIDAPVEEQDKVTYSCAC
jgi:hypothetical protein